MDDLFSGVKSQIKPVLNMLCTSKLTKRTISYFRHDSDAFDSVAGAGKATFTEYTSIKAARLPHTKRSASAMNSQVEAGDTFYLIRSKNIPTGSSLKDEIEDAGQRYKITDLYEIFDLGVVATVVKN